MRKRTGKKKVLTYDADAIWRRRIAMRKTQGELAELAEMSRYAYWMAEHGHAPWLRTLRKLEAVMAIRIIND